MKIVTVASQKGGAGKTTLSVNLAAAALAKGLRVQILDGDPQGSAGVWAQLRGNTGLVRSIAQSRHLQDDLDKCRANHIDLLIIDTRPAAGPESADLVLAADIVLIPVRPSIFDLSAAQKTINFVKSGTARALIVISAAPVRAPEIEMAREALADTGVAVAAQVIHDRVAFSRSIQAGSTVVESEPDGKAADEIKALLAEVLA